MKWFNRGETGGEPKRDEGCNDRFILPKLCPNFLPVTYSVRKFSFLRAWGRRFKSSRPDQKTPPQFLSRCHSSEALKIGFGRPRPVRISDFSGATLWPRISCLHFFECHYWESQDWNLRADLSPPLIPQPSLTVSGPEFVRWGVLVLGFVNFTKLQVSQNEAGKDYSLKERITIGTLGRAPWSWRWGSIRHASSLLDQIQQ